MHRSLAKAVLVAMVFLSLLIGLFRVPVQAGVMAQVPTVDIATVTSTATGPIITVKGDGTGNQINVRSGPGTAYAKVGVLLVGQQSSAKGRSVGGEWILIDYPGVAGSQAWVYSSLVDLSPGPLSIIEPPPTPTPLMTMTIDPTLAAQFVVTSAATRLPTYTPPPPLAIPTFAADTGGGLAAGLPMGMIILGLAAVGLFVGLFALAQGR